MKIIQEGTSRSPWSKEFTCTGKGNGVTGCGALLLVEMEDLFITRSSHYDGSTETYTTFKCEYCGALNDIDDRPSGSLPSHREWTAKRIEAGQPA